VTAVFRNPATFDVAQQLNVTQSALTYPNLKGVSVVAADPNSLEGVMKTAKAKGMVLAQGAAGNRTDLLRHAPSGARRVGGEVPRSADGRHG
jgi:hypothetical protein